LPAKSASAKVYCNVIRKDTIYEYHYTVKNKEESKRRIQRFNVKSGANAYAQSYGSWFALGSDKRFPCLAWRMTGLNDRNLIRQGESKSEFFAKSKFTPGINSYYIQSERELMTIKYNLYDLLNDIITNSTSGLTISPQTPIDPFVPLTFLDTLLSYTRQSSELGWLIDKHTKNRIEDKLNLAKLLLQKSETCKSGPSPDTLIDQAYSNLDKDESRLKEEYGDEAVGRYPNIVKDDKDLKKYKTEMSKSPKNRKLSKTQCIDLCEKAYKYLALKTLQSLVMEVEILNRISEKSPKKYFTSEAYALLKYNTEYLIKQLQ
jgi:hypothetical protein